MVSRARVLNTVGRDLALERAPVDPPNETPSVRQEPHQPADGQTHG
jgi:hypothetical protein